MRILLINTNLKDDFMAAPPIGLAYVASAAQDAGHEVHVLDLCFRKDVRGDLDEALCRIRPELIGLSIRNLDNVNLMHPVSYVPEAEAMVGRIRRLSRAPIVLGGSGASLSPRSLLERLEADYIIVSEGESSFVELLRRLQEGESTDGIPGLGRRIRGEFSMTPPVLRDFPSVDAQLGRWIDMKPYMRMGSSYTIQTKRGCLLQCIYCTYNQVLEGRNLRLRSPVEVVDELEEALLKYRPESFEFVDSVFNRPYDHCMEILEEIVRRPWKARFTAMGVHPVRLDAPFLDLMWRAGFRSFMITPESASETMIRSYRKGFHKDDLVQAAEAVRKTGFTVMWFFLVGGPGETNRTLQETLDFNFRHLRMVKRPPYNMSNFYLGVRLYPGTEMWRIAMEEGFVTDRSDPLDSLWYVSEGLDLTRAVRQMVDAASLCPEIVLGFDEQFLALSWIVSRVGGLFRMAKPYWRHTWGLNQLLIKTGFRFPSGPPPMVARIRESLRRQGYKGPLLGDPPPQGLDGPQRGVERPVFPQRGRRDDSADAG
ncbi:MAG: radical SAM protein [Deltaproteobacteria bacterium]|nr:radical SAM protein [Deltaproteobacteria bacterium]